MIRHVELSSHARIGGSECHWRLESDFLRVEGTRGRSWTGSGEMPPINPAYQMICDTCDNALYAIFADHSGRVGVKGDLEGEELGIGWVGICDLNCLYRSSLLLNF